jgi:hypothetical protein
MRFLHIEPVKIFRTKISNDLQGFAQIVGVSTVQEALEILSQESFALILCPYMVSETQTAIDLRAKLTQMHIPTPCVVLDQEANETMAWHAMHCGIHLTLPKGIAKEALQTSLTQLLQKPEIHTINPSQLEFTIITWQTGSQYFALCPEYNVSAMAPTAEAALFKMRKMLQEQVQNPHPGYVTKNIQKATIKIITKQDD